MARTMTMNTKLASGMAAGCDGAHVRGLLASNAASAREARQHKAEDDLIDTRCTVRVNGEFMNFYCEGELVGYVDRETLIPTEMAVFAVPSASFAPGVPAAAFERAAVRRMVRARMEAN